VRSFRNLARIDAEWSHRFNVISGDNGQGKTNILESIYVVATSKSFRTSRLGELVDYRSDVASVRAMVNENGEVRVQSVGIERGKRWVKIDDKRPSSLSAFAVRSPVVVFHPGEMSLSMGSSDGRRRLLDRTALYAWPQSMTDLHAYARAIKARQRILDVRGVKAAELADWETLAVRHGLQVMIHRARATELLNDFATKAFARIAAPELALDVAYAPSAPNDLTEYERELALRRVRDLSRGSASIGPHRDDLALRLDGRAVRGFASQGQHRAVTLALKSAEIEVIGTVRGLRPMLLLDDVSSELDRARTLALFSFLRELKGQVFLTTTRPELIDTGSDSLARRDFHIEGGSLTHLTP
jgi:DNA replication and repair protein RecF